MTARAIASDPILPQSPVEGAPVPEIRVTGVALPALKPLDIPKKLPPMKLVEDKSHEKIFWIFVVALSAICAGFCLFSLIPAGIGLLRLFALSQRKTQLDVCKERAHVLDLQRDSLCNQYWHRKMGLEQADPEERKMILFEMASLRVALERVDRDLLSAYLSLSCEMQRESMS